MAFIPVIAASAAQNEKIRYTCGICGKNTESVKKIRQCPICLSPLCSDCSIFGFCHEDYGNLNYEDKQNIVNSFEKEGNYENMNIMTIFVVGIIIALCGGLFILLTFGNILSSISWPIISIMAIILLFGFITAVSSSTRHKENGKHKEIVREISKKYRFEKSNNPEKLYTTELTGKFCPSCGNGQSDNSNFCTRCGQKIN